MSDKMYWDKDPGLATHACYQYKKYLLKTQGYRVNTRQKGFKSEHKTKMK